MKNTKGATGRITVRVRADLLAKAKVLAAKKRWSLNTFIEEALNNEVAAINNQQS